MSIYEENKPILVKTSSFEARQATYSETKKWLPYEHSTLLTVDREGVRCIRIPNEMTIISEVFIEGVRWGNFSGWEVRSKVTRERSIDTSCGAEKYFPVEKAYLYMANCPPGSLVSVVLTGYRTSVVKTIDFYSSILTQCVVYLIAAYLIYQGVA
jgi:hypothetical protein